MRYTQQAWPYPHCSHRLVMYVPVHRLGRDVEQLRRLADRPKPGAVADIHGVAIVHRLVLLLRRLLAGPYTEPTGRATRPCSARVDWRRLEAALGASQAGTLVELVGRTPLDRLGKR